MEHPDKKRLIEEAVALSEAQTLAAFEGRTEDVQMHEYRLEAIAQELKLKGIEFKPLTNERYKLD